MTSGNTPTIDHMKAPQTGPAETPAAKTGQARLADLTQRFAMLGVLVAIVIAAQIAYSSFLTSGNIENMLQQNAPVGLVAIGMTFVLIGGGF